MRKGQPGVPGGTTELANVKTRLQPVSSAHLILDQTGLAIPPRHCEAPSTQEVAPERCAILDPGRPLTPLSLLFEV